MREEERSVARWDMRVTGTCRSEPSPPAQGQESPVPARAAHARGHQACRPTALRSRCRSGGVGCSLKYSGPTQISAPVPPCLLCHRPYVFPGVNQSDAPGERRSPVYCGANPESPLGVSKYRSGGTPRPGAVPRRLGFSQAPGQGLSVCPRAWAAGRQLWERAVAPGPQVFSSAPGVTWAAR